VIFRLRPAILCFLAFCCRTHFAAQPQQQQQQPLRVLVIDGVNNHDWAAGTRYIRAILEGTRRF